MIIVTDREPKISDLEKLVGELDKIGKIDFLRLETDVFPLKYSQSSKLVNFAKSRLSNEGVVQADDERNTLIITDYRSKINSFKEVIEKIDTPLKQILISARIIEVVNSRAKDVGIDITSLLSRNTINYNYDKQYVKQSYQSQSSSNISRRTSLALSKSPVSDIINMMIEKGIAISVANPHITTLNNKTAEIFIGEKEEYYDGNEGGVHVSVTPTIGNSDLITLNISLKSGELITTESEYYSNSNVKGQEIKSTIMVKDGETFVVGGLKGEIRKRTTRKLPVLGDVLPGLFSKKIETKEDTEIIVIVTPKILGTYQANQEQLETIKKLEGKTILK